jgi:hypothetical protein
MVGQVRGGGGMGGGGAGAWRGARTPRTEAYDESSCTHCSYMTLHSHESIAHMT